MTYRLTSTAHFLTIDVIEPERVAGMLEMLDRHAASATFFIPGDIARQHPAVPRAIARTRHEVAVYGGDASRGDWNDFRHDVRAARTAIEDACGAHVRGFRAPRGTLGPTTAWAFEILVEEGFEYDSTCVPDRVPGRSRQTPDYPHAIACAAGSMIELPVSRLDWSGRALRARTQAGMSAVVSLATSDLSDTPPRRLALLPLARRATRESVARLLAAYRFDAIAHRFAELAFSAPTNFAA